MQILQNLLSTGIHQNGANHSINKINWIQLIQLINLKTSKTVKHDEFYMKIVFIIFRKRRGIRI